MIGPYPVRKMILLNVHSFIESTNIGVIFICTGRAKLLGCQELSPHHRRRRMVEIGHTDIPPRGFDSLDGECHGATRKWESMGEGMGIHYLDHCVYRECVW